MTLLKAVRTSQQDLLGPHSLFELIVRDGMCRVLQTRPALTVHVWQGPSTSGMLNLRIIGHVPISGSLGTLRTHAFQYKHTRHMLHSEHYNVYGEPSHQSLLLDSNL